MPCQPAFEQFAQSEQEKPEKTEGLAKDLCIVYNCREEYKKGRSKPLPYIIKMQHT